MKRITVQLLALAFVLAVSTLGAHADTYMYNFSAPASGNSPGYSITFETTSLLASDWFTSSNAALFPNNHFLSSNTPTITAIEINPMNGQCGIASPIRASGCVELYFSNGSKAVFDFYASTMNSVGNFSTNSGGANLTITDLDSPAPVPEPSSIVMLGTGMAGLAGAARRKFFARR